MPVFFLNIFLNKFLTNSRGKLSGIPGDCGSRSHETKRGKANGAPRAAMRAISVAGEELGLFFFNAAALGVGLLFFRFVFFRRRLLSPAQRGPRLPL